ncbi:hypothetical protein NADFUDRAFT_47838 [Nadsonia fulvescens var. elongata DSM 6958]|uniref:Uncharacterized protein n=1 Tax=Nadsonia fulvescens var. elongata DSM 6958 TaxID=857566 RepID=A0A1E3PFH3_9ASCO|nr:hypothetical protein NADFUDRAFT_47838 [Nadsonia fulvescens var. elongata DSM 6958]
MEPGLREVLEALEDEAYVGEEIDDEEDIFSQIISSGRKEASAAEEFDWDNFDPKEYGSDFSDNTVTGADDLGLGRDAFSTNYSHSLNEGFDDADIQFKNLGEEVSYGEEPFTGDATAPEYVDWEAEFKQFKIDQASSKNAAGYDSDSEAGDGLGALTTISRVGRKGKGKTKKSGGTELTGFSMSSSAIFRNEGLTLLDDKFDKLEEVYMNDDVEEEYVPEFDITKERSDFESIMDDFLDNYDVVGKKMWKKTSKGATTGIEQLNDIRAAMR